MRQGRLNLGQRFVIVIALGVSLYLFAQWLIGYWEFGSSGFGWVAYAPLSTAGPLPRVLLHPWVVFLIRLLLTLIWMMLSIALLRGRTGESEEIDAGSY